MVLIFSRRSVLIFLLLFQKSWREVDAVGGTPVASKPLRQFFPVIKEAVEYYKHKGEETKINLFFEKIENMEATHSE